MIKKLLIGMVAVSSMSVSAVQARDIHVVITNLSNALYFTPLLVSAHDGDTHLFNAGVAASANLQAMAEGGDISGLQADLMAVGANSVANPAGGLLAPGASAGANLDTDDNNKYLSVVAMLLPTNDGFMGLNAVEIPKKKGAYTFYINGYDAGTEANNEVINGGGMPGVLGIPADPGGNSGSGATGVTTVEHNNKVHVHRGTLGDDDLLGGKSDLDVAVHHWLNPVAKVTIYVD